MASTGFLVVDKPSGITSHDLVAAVRRATGIKKCGHAGTLDPMATGVVVVAVGRATRLIRFVQDTFKEYTASAVFGVATDSLDADGKVIERSEMSVSSASVEAAAAGLVGSIDQVPPMVSALKHEGKRLYQLAREGIEVERKPRRIEVHELEILEVGEGPFPIVRFRVLCGKGTYVRSLADDMAISLGGRAHLVALRRTKVGGFTLGDALSMDALDDWENSLIRPSAGLQHLPSVSNDAERATLISHGRRIENDSAASGPVRMLGPEGELLAVYVGDGPLLVPDVVMA